jgi:hypothetical protein
MAPLIANVRGQFAEFLNQRYPERLSMLYPPTCVSFSTVRITLTRSSFSWTSVGRFLPEDHACATGISNAPIVVQTPSLYGKLYKLGNVNPKSIVYASRPRLRYRLTLGGFTFPRKP